MVRTLGAGQLSTVESLPTWALLLISLAYFSMPLDIVPDVFCGIGYADDAAVIGYTAYTIYKRLTGKENPRSLPPSVTPTDSGGATTLGETLRVPDTIVPQV